MVENLAFELQFPQFPFILSASIISWVTDSKKRRGFDGSKPTVRYHKESSSDLILTWHGPKGRVSHCPEASRFGISWSTGRGKQTSFYFHISWRHGTVNRRRLWVRSADRVWEPSPDPVPIRPCLLRRKQLFWAAFLFAYIMIEKLKFGFMSIKAYICKFENQL